MQRQKALLLLVLIALGGCQGNAAPPSNVSATPAPTSVPPPGPRPTEPAPPATLPAGPTAAGPTPAGAPTRVVPPPEAIQLPPGFGLTVYASGLRDPRMLALGPDGLLYVAERGAGRIVRLPDRDGDGVGDGVEVVAEGLNAPSSIAFYRDGSLYVGETERILRLSEPDAQGVFQKQEVVVAGLPTGGHSTRTVLFSPDWQWLFVSIGSSCNVCLEQDPRRATIVRYAADGSGGEVYAKGLRNAVGITFRPGTEELWPT